MDRLTYAETIELNTDLLVRGLIPKGSTDCSGTGKLSVLKAGIMKDLRPEDYQEILSLMDEYN